MLESRAVVLNRHNDTLEVALERDSGCQGCQQCGVSTISRLMPNHLRVQLTSSKNVQVGEKIVLSLPERGLLNAAWRCYLLPLGVLVGGAVLGDAVAGDGGAVLLGLVGLLSGVLIVHSLNHRLLQDADYQPEIHD
jgi:sigma-E factor negative regulatory protein RseC